MSSAFDSHADYAQFVFAFLAERASVESHTISVYTTGRTIGITRGEVVFKSGYTLRVIEQIDFIAHRILHYFYEVTYQGERQWWYDPMPHPDIPELQSTHPHHKHIPPDVKRHRVPAPGMSFVEPNLANLIAEVERLSRTTDATTSP